MRSDELPILNSATLQLPILEMSYKAEKNRTRFSSTPVSPNNTRFSKRSRNSGFQSLADFEEKDIVSGATLSLLT